MNPEIQWENNILDFGIFHYFNSFKILVLGFPYQYTDCYLKNRHLLPWKQNESILVDPQSQSDKIFLIIILNRVSARALSIMTYPFASGISPHRRLKAVYQRSTVLVLSRFRWFFLFFIYLILHKLSNKQMININLCHKSVLQH